MTEDALDFTPAPIANPDLPTGGRAALGAAAGLSFAMLAAAAWAKLEHDQWDPNIPTRRARWGLAGAWLLGATAGASVAARPGTRYAAAVGTALGVVVTQVPLILDPAFVNNHPILGNIWQYGVPIAGAVLGVNAVNSTREPR